jgi:hypothetical protein
VSDPGLRFWLRYVEATGGLWEPNGDTMLVVLPPEPTVRWGLAEELRVTGDPDVARTDAATLLCAGHPVLTEVAESLLDDGDAGILRLEGPPGPHPAGDVLEGRARAQVPVNHGRIDVTGPPIPMLHWVLRVGAMVSYAVSAEDHFTERVERWVHVNSRREVPAAIVEALVDAPRAPDVPAGPAGDLAASLAEADRLIEAAALLRRAELGRQLANTHEEERARARRYYADATAAIERRLDAAPPERRALLEARLASTREEEARRLVEIAEKYQPGHDVRPYRLHLIGVPALRLPVDVRRGERRYRIDLDWLTPARAFAHPRCPSCDAAAPLVAGKNRLGCLVCSTPKFTASTGAASAPPGAAHSGAAPEPRSGPSGDRAEQAASTRAKPISTPPKPAPTKPPAKRPTTPPAKRAKTRTRPVAPPNRANTVTLSLWNAVAAGRGRALRDVLAAGSPAAAMYTVYGTDGFRHAIGLPAGEELLECTTGTARVDAGWGVTSGVVRTARGEYQYWLRWQDDTRPMTVVEMLSCPLIRTGQFHPYYWSFDERNPYRVTRIPTPVTRPDRVAVLLLELGGAWHGLALAARALAAWWRLGDRHDELLAVHPPDALAACVHRLVSHRAGDHGRFREAAGLYRADETSVRRADSQVRRLLDLGPARSW